jgi:uncharacterized metal-binding protein
MPSGEIHYRFYKAGFFTAIPSTIYLLTISPSLGLGNLIGYFCHRWIDNDWDVYGINEAESRAVNELWILGYMIYGVSSSYGAMFRRKHRSFLSHFPIISTLIRLIFLFWWLPILYWNGAIEYSFWHIQFYTGFLLGLSHADTYHYFADNIWKEESDGLEFRFLNRKKYKSSKYTKNKNKWFDINYSKILKAILSIVIGYAYNKFIDIKNFKNKR